MDDYRIRDIEHLTSLWRNIYSTSGKIDWSGMLPYYADDIRFKDAVQEIRGKERFTAMTRRLARRSKKLRFLIHQSCMQGDLAFVEWEMVISYKGFPESSVYGSSRLKLRDGKVADQRDYYDLWGDIFDNIPFVDRAYRAFMGWGFG
jgi:ketosteroid isomerase-like protein